MKQQLTLAACFLPSRDRLSKFTPLFLAPLFLLAGQASAATPIAGNTNFGTGSSTLAYGPANTTGLTAQNVFGWDFHLVTRSTVSVGLYLGDLAWKSGSGVEYYPDSGFALSMDSFSGSSNGGEYPAGRCLRRALHHSPPPLKRNQGVAKRVRRFVHPNGAGLGNRATDADPP